MSKPMTEERLREIDDQMAQRGYLDNETTAELLAEVNRLRTLPPEVAAAMERYGNREELLRLESYYEYETDLDTIAAHFTALFQKGTP